MPDRLRDLLLTARAVAIEEIARIDSELQRLAGQTPEERRAWIRRMNRPMKPLAVAGLAAATVWTWLHHAPMRAVLAGVAAGVAAALIVWALLPNPGPVPSPPDRAVPSTSPTPRSPPTPAPSPTPTLSPVPPEPPPSPAGAGATPPAPQPTQPGRRTEPAAPPRATAPPEEQREKCLRLRTPAVNVPRCLERIGELLPVPDLTPSALIAVPP